MDGGDGNSILDGLLNLENSERHDDARVQGRFGEVHSRADAASIAKANFSGIRLGFLAWSGDVAFWVELEGFWVHFLIMEHVPVRY